MQNVKHVSAQLSAHFRLSSTLSPLLNDVAYHTSRVLYFNAVESLMYVMVYSWPNLSYAVGAVNRYLANSGHQHSKAVQWILRYLSSFIDVCLHLGVTRDGISGYVDSDYLIIWWSLFFYWIYFYH